MKLANYCYIRSDNDLLKVRDIRYIVNAYGVSIEVTVSPMYATVQISKVFSDKKHASSYLKTIIKPLSAWKIANPELFV